MRILALTWTTRDNETELMINARRDLLCPAIDGFTNELLNLGHQVVYVNVFAEHVKLSEQDLRCPGMISGLPFYLWSEIKNKKFDVIWHAIKDPTPQLAIPYVEKIMQELDPNIPVLNNIKDLQNHTKRKYINLLRKKNVGCIILDDYKGWWNENGTVNLSNAFPPSQGCYVSKDYYAIRTSMQNSGRIKPLFDEEGGITLKYHDTSKRPGAEPNLRTFVRVPFSAGKCLEGWKYFCPTNILCPKSGAAVKKIPYSFPDMTAGTISAAMKELGVDLAHIEAVEAGFSIEIFDVNPFPSSHGASLQPMAKKMAKRLEQVYDI